MCKYLLNNDRCEIRTPNSDGSIDIQASIRIRQAFNEAAQKSSNYKDAPMGVGCGGRSCCFVAGVYAIWDDCPYYQVV